MIYFQTSGVSGSREDVRKRPATQRKPSDIVSVRVTVMSTSIPVLMEMLSSSTIVRQLKTARMNINL